MRLVVALFASCQLYASGVAAAEMTCRNNWSELAHTKPAVVLTSRFVDFQIGQTAPDDLLEKIGPLICAAGSEELRVRTLAPEPAASPLRAIMLVEFIRGREVRQSSVSIILNIETHEVTMLQATFLPDRTLDREPRLTAAQAWAKVVAQMRKEAHVTLSTGEHVKIALLDAPPAFLAYEIEQFGSAQPRGLLVWVFSGTDLGDNEPYEVSVSALEGEVIRLQHPTGD